MLIQAGWSVAVYCQRCGQIQVHDISYFERNNRNSALRCACGHHLAKLVRTTSNTFILQIHCVVCNSVHNASYKAKQLLKMKLEKIYCDHDRFELGYIGRRDKIEELLAFNKRGIEVLDTEHNAEQIEKQQVLLEVLNKVHDIAEQGELTCPCGSIAIFADIIDDDVVLECQHCGGYYVAPARCENDFKQISGLEHIDLLQGVMLRKNIDLD